MKLITKFNLVLGIVFLVGLAVAAFVSQKVLRDNAREEVIAQARMMMAGALAVREYTISEIRPLIKAQSQVSFLPQTVPSYAATQNFHTLQKINPDYSYKEATLNPTNLRDKVTDWEADIITQFRTHGGLGEVVGERMTPTGPSLYIAKPIKIENEACLTCHSTVDRAPESMIKLYGPANGFGWQLNEIVGSQIVSVPTAIAMEKANREFTVFMTSLVTIFVVIFLLINLMLRSMIINKVNTMAGIADRVSKGESDVPEFESRSNDEICALGKSFNRMRISLEKAMKMLEE